MTQVSPTPVFYWEKCEAPTSALSTLLQEHGRERAPYTSRTTGNSCRSSHLTSACGGTSPNPIGRPPIVWRDSIRKSLIRAQTDSRGRSSSLVKALGALEPRALPIPILVSSDHEPASPTPSVKK